MKGFEHWIEIKVTSHIIGCSGPGRVNFMVFTPRISEEEFHPKLFL